MIIGRPFRKRDCCYRRFNDRVNRFRYVGELGLETLMSKKNLIKIIAKTFYIFKFIKQLDFLPRELIYRVYRFLPQTRMTTDFYCNLPAYLVSLLFSGSRIRLVFSSLCMFFAKYYKRSARAGR